MSGAVWAVTQMRDGALSGPSREAITAAQRLAALVGAEAEAVVLGETVDAAAKAAAGFRLAAVRTAAAAALEPYTPGAWVETLARAVEAHAPAWLVFPHTYQTVDFAPRLAARLEAPMISEAVALEAGDGGPVWVRPILGGKLQARVRARGDGPALVSVQAGAFAGDEAEAGEAPVEALGIDLGSVEPDRQIVRFESAGEEQVDLSKAPVVVAVGRGLGGPDNLAPVEELAKELGGELGASRPVIDSGWLPRDRQIGSSGQTVAPKLYLALGISGAIQHLVGMKGSQVVVAVNKDRSAPIFAVADYGLVGDLHEIVPAMTAALREAREG